MKDDEMGVLEAQAEYAKSADAHVRQRMGTYQSWLGHGSKAGHLLTMMIPLLMAPVMTYEAAG